MIIDETVSFLPGDWVGSSRCVSVMINDDTEEEGDESFQVIIISSLAQVVNDPITTTIIDDDVGRQFESVHSSFTTFMHKINSSTVWKCQLCNLSLLIFYMYAYILHDIALC